MNVAATLDVKYPARPKEEKSVSKDYNRVRGLHSKVEGDEKSITLQYITDAADCQLYCLGPAQTGIISCSEKHRA
jgi:hypothetical protein